MSNCSSILGGTKDYKGLWSFDYNCNLLGCLCQGNSYNNWNDCSNQCCSLKSYTYQGVENCIN